jgi:UPF0271 protein
MEPFGDGGLRVRLPEEFDAPGLLEALRSLPGVVDAVVTERHALVTFDPTSPPSAVRATITGALSHRGSLRPPRAHQIRVHYAGEDLDEVARQAGLLRRDVIALHAGGDYLVAAIGFLPGFAYLRGLDARLLVPRRAEPRARVPRLSVAIGGPYTGVYPFESPGGWNLLGTAPGFSPFDPRTGALLALGDRVRFVEADG